MLLMRYTIYNTYQFHNLNFEFVPEDKPLKFKVKVKPSEICKKILVQVI